MDAGMQNDAEKIENIWSEKVLVGAIEGSSIIGWSWTSGELVYGCSIPRAETS